MHSPSIADARRPGLIPLSDGAAAVPARSAGRNRRSAFTLLEIMIALAIIGMLVTIAITKLGGSFDTAQVSTATLFVTDSMKAPLLSYKISTGDYPTTEQGLQALVTAPAAVADRWTGPYVEVTGGKIPLDPWKRPYQYRYPGVHNKTGYDLWSTGPSGQDGAADNIGNW
jgi:general secretion pathway protein G